MLRTIVPGLLVALLVVTAGCVGGGGPDSTPEPGAVDDGGDGGGADASGADGGGVDASGAAGEVALVENRTAALLEAGSYTSVWQLRTTEDGTLVGELSYTTALDYEAQRYSFEMTATSEGETRTSLASYYADGRSYQRLGGGEDVTYTSADGEFDAVAQFGRSASVYGVGTLEDFKRAGTETYDGVRVTRYVMEERASWLAAQQQTDAEVRWTDFTYEVLVDDDGLVRSERWTGTGVDDEGTEHTVEFSYALTGVGSTDVAEPAWLDEARS